MKYRHFLALSLVLFSLGCRSHPVSQPDRPQLTADVRIVDAKMHSVALGQDLQFRLVVPATVSVANEPIVYLLHGAGVSFYDWTNNSPIASLAEKGVVLVLPNLPNAYYINQANGKADEDFLLKELAPEIHRRVPNASFQRERTAIVGISRGGYGSVTVGLRHPEIFGFVGGLSPALDFPERRFRWHDPLAFLESHEVFGPRDSLLRKNNDPYLLVRRLPQEQVPALFIACGDREVLAPVVRRFVSLALSRKIAVDFHEFPGGHNWLTWNAAIPPMESSLLRFFSAGSGKGKAS